MEPRTYMEHRTQEAIAELNRIKLNCDRLIAFLESGWDAFDFDKKDPIRWIKWGSERLEVLSNQLDRSFWIAREKNGKKKK